MAAAKKDDPSYLGPVSASPQVCAEEMLRLAGVTSTDVVYDLGCGDGRVVVTAAKQCGVRGVGIETEAAPVAKAHALVAQEGVGGLVTILHKDVFDVDLSEATVVFMYLLPKGNSSLSDKLQRELRPGTRIVTYIFKMPPEWTPCLQTVLPLNTSSKIDTSNISKLHLYHVGPLTPLAPPTAAADVAKKVKVLAAGKPCKRKVGKGSKWQRKENPAGMILERVLCLGALATFAHQICRRVHRQ